MKLSEAEFESVVEDALAKVPAALTPYLENVVVDIEPMPDAETLRRLGIRDARSLLGHYHGTPITRRSVEHAGTLPDRIVIYQRNVERRCRTREEVIGDVLTTILHEVGHHFGLDEDDLHELGFG